MSLVGTGLNCTTTLGARCQPADASLTLASVSAAWPASGRVHLNLSDTEEVYGDISGTTVSNLVRAVEKIGSFTTAQDHPAGDSVKLIASYRAMQDMFPWKFYDSSGVTFPIASISIPTIPAGYGTARLRWFARSDTAATSTNILLRINNDATANYEWQRMIAAATVQTDSESGGASSIYMGDVPGATATANLFGAGWAEIINYAGTTGDKIVTGQNFVSTGNGTGVNTIYNFGGKIRTTGAAITRLDILPGAGNFIAGSYFALQIDPT